MKKIFYILGCAALTMMTSCSDFLDTVPKGKVIPTTVDDFGNIMKDISLSTAYDAMSYYCSDDVILPDERANMTLPTSKAYYWMEDFYKKDEADRTWNNTYQHIYTVNVVINSIMDATEGTMADKKRILAEAKMFRAYYYWYLHSLYGQYYDPKTASKALSVPMPLAPNLEAVLSREPVKTVVEQILDDLNSIGTEDLPIVGSNPYKPTRASWYALKARVLFYLGRYDEASVEADNALSLNSKLDDMRTWSFLDDSKPSTNIVGKPQNIASEEKLWYFSVNGSGDLRMMVIDDELLALYRANPKDLRFKFWFSNKDEEGEYYYDENTYCYLQQTPNYNIGVPEMMLIKAEALARQNDPEALNVLNNLRTYRFLEEDYEALSQGENTDLLTLVLEERRRELVLSGLRWFDMRRLAHEGKYTKTLQRTTPDGTVRSLAPNSSLYVFPIPLEVISKNNHIEPNVRK